MTMVEEDSEQSEQGSDQQMIELNQTVDHEQLNKQLLYEGWLEDFERQKRQRNNKKRKRSAANSNKSRSPTPVSSRGNL
jgi:hypothetical protein